MGDAHLVNFVGAVGKTTPSRLLQHSRQRRIGRVAERTVNLDCPVDDAPQAVRHEVLGHRHLGDEIHLVLELVGGVQNHQLALVELDC